jgi:hypothetical protein
MNQTTAEMQKPSSFLKLNKPWLGCGVSGARYGEGLECSKSCENHETMLPQHAIINFELGYKIAKTKYRILP